MFLVKIVGAFWWGGYLPQEDLPSAEKTIRVQSRVVDRVSSPSQL